MQKTYIPSIEEIAITEKNLKIRQLDDVINKHSNRLKIIKQNLKNEVDNLCDKDTEKYNYSIQLVAEFCTDLRQLKKDLFD